MHGLRSGVDPDDQYNDVPYEKGYAFLMFVRERVLDGDTLSFDEWLKCESDASCPRASRNVQGREIRADHCPIYSHVF